MLKIITNKSDYHFSPELQAEYRRMNPDTKIRIQCVLHENGLQSIDEMLAFMEHYKDCVDDFSFRRLITISHSNMGLLRRMEENEPDNLLREIVVHPDGHISGSWYRNRKEICSAE